jgi:homoserine kinase
MLACNRCGSALPLRIPIVNTATAPASSANLGPGFDCLGLAFELRCHVVAAPADEWIIEELGTSFEPAPDDFVRRIVQAVVGRPMRLTIDNDVPRSRGLGSSSAVMTAAAAASLRAMGREPDSDELFAVVAGIEGHGDNAAAAVYGGLVAVNGDQVLHLDLDPGLVFVCGIPDMPLKTRVARGALPAVISRAAGVRNVARAAFLVEGLRTGNAAALAAAGGDELHEAYRTPLSPVTGELVAAAREAGAFHAAWSGAGPTAIAVVAEPSDVVEAMEKVLAGKGRVVVLDVATAGWR